MDSWTFQELSERVDLIELAVGKNTNNFNNSKSQKDSSVVSRLAQLQSHLDSIYSTNSEFVTLNRILKDLSIWNKLKVTPSVQLNEDLSSLDNETEIGREIKEELLLLKYPAIKEAYSNLTELSNMDIPKLINFIESSQDKTHNYNNDQVSIMQREDQLNELSQLFHQLVIKNMIVLEKYINMMIRENNFWLTCDQKLHKLNAKVNSLKRQQDQQSKY
ncbi:uncharacterized protein RJT20DRAFT_135390 [Scheffersomyces xylosifermentans]|uniref:uncharacterized protein n=1 Tax=Scheffersomyces xylosifermentans TaxID=1304137 RepID=UPI00315D319F